MIFIVLSGHSPQFLPIHSKLKVNYKLGSSSHSVKVTIWNQQVAKRSANARLA